MNPCSFDWAKKFLSSPAWAFFSSPKASNLSFSIPQKCPTQASSSCFVGNGQCLVNSIEEIVEAIADLEDDLSQQADSAQQMEEGSTPRVPWSTEILRKAGKLKISKADPTLRRSGRMKAHNKGFKGKGCPDKRCIACDFDPPVISPFIIKNLGITFCNIDPQQVSETALLKKKKASSPGEKKNPSLRKHSKDGDDDAPKKNSKK